MKLLLSVLLFCLACPLTAQSSDLFPDARHAELREAIVYAEPDAVEPDIDGLDADGPDFDWSAYRQPLIWLFTAIIVGGLGFLVYRILGDLELRRGGGATDATRRVAVEEIVEEELVRGGVSDDLLTRAETAGQYDIAVRLLYIALLKQLQDARLITYRKDFSNRDYRRQLGGNPLLEAFTGVTRAYERYWYGEYPIDRLGYRVVQTDFRNLSSRIDA